MLIKLEAACLEDAKLVTELKTTAYRDEKLRFSPPPDRTPKWFDHEWYNDIPETIRLINKYPYFKILDSENEIIGCFWLRGIDKSTMELEDLCIHPGHQGKGYGYQTLLLMENTFPNIKKWTLGTPFYSVRNHHLYEKAGYIKTGERAENTVFLYEKVK